MTNIEMLLTMPHQDRFWPYLSEQLFDNTVLRKFVKTLCACVGVIQHNKINTIAWQVDSPSLKRRVSMA